MCMCVAECCSELKCVLQRVLQRVLQCGENSACQCDIWGGYK